MEMQLLTRKIFFLPNFSLAGILRSRPTTIATGVIDTNQEPSSRLSLTTELQKEHDTAVKNHRKWRKKIFPVFCQRFFATLMTRADEEEFV